MTTMTKPDKFVIADSGKRETYKSGMCRDVIADKLQYHRLFYGPLAPRLVAHLTAGAKKYPDEADGTPNWMLANSREELNRFAESATRHFYQWLTRVDDGQDHFASVVFNLTAWEYVKEKLDVAAGAASEPLTVREIQAREGSQTRIYIAGPMSGIEGHNFPAFNAAAKMLRSLGYDVVNPAECDDGRTDLEWAYCMRRDLKLLVDCDLVVALPGWFGSKGACLEADVASRLGMEVVDYYAFLNTEREFDSAKFHKGL